MAMNRLSISPLDDVPIWHEPDILLLPWKQQVKIDDLSDSFIYISGSHYHEINDAVSSKNDSRRRRIPVCLEVSNIENALVKLGNTLMLMLTENKK